MSGILAALAGGGGGRLLTVGLSGVAPAGFDVGAGYGSLTPTEFLASNINSLRWITSFGLRLKIDNTAATNSGWETLNIGGTVFLRSDASYSSGNWIWSSVTNPFSGMSAGQVVAVNIA